LQLKYILVQLSPSKLHLELRIAPARVIITILAYDSSIRQEQDQ